MSQELEELKAINKNIEKLNANIERLIGYLATQPQENKKSYISDNQLDVSMNVKAKVEEARKKAEARISQAKSSLKFPSFTE